MLNLEREEESVTTPRIPHLYQHRRLVNYADITRIVKMVHDRFGIHKGINP